MGNIIHASIPCCRVFSIISFICSLLYATYHYSCGRKMEKKYSHDVMNQERGDGDSEKLRKPELKPFLIKKGGD